MEPKPSKADDQLLIATRKHVDDIHDLLKKPWGFDGSTDVFDRYKDPSGKTNYSKLMRNASFAQRLYKMQDEIINSVVAIQILRDEVKLTSSDKTISDQVIKDIEFGHIPTTTIRAIACFFNALTYFFDFPPKDGAYDLEEIINYTYLRDPEIGTAVAKLIDTPDFRLNKLMHDELERGYYGLVKITSTDSDPFKLEAANGPSSDEVVAASEAVLLGLQITLSKLLEFFRDKYATSIGYTSPHDLIVRSHPQTGAWMRSDNDDRKESDVYKIYNFWLKSPNTVETNRILLSKNIMFNDSLKRRYQSQKKETISYRFDTAAPSEVTRKILPTQEGEHAWTHTILLKRPIKRVGIRVKQIEDITLCLTWLSGYAVYSEDSMPLYSHKTKAVNRFNEFEYAPVLKHMLKVLSRPSKDNNLLRTVLSKYRLSLQPNSSDMRFIRLWEIVDIIADYYCTDNRKALPSGYEDHNELREKLAEELLKVEEATGIPVNPKGEVTYAPIHIDKSIGQKVRELLDNLQLAQDIGSTRPKLNKRIGDIYTLRSSMTHSSSTRDRKKDVEMINAYFFVNELVFIIIAKLFDCPDVHSSQEIKASLRKYADDKNYYTKRSTLLKRQGKRAERAFEILAGTRPWPKGKKSISF